MIFYFFSERKITNILLGLFMLLVLCYSHDSNAQLSPEVSNLRCQKLAWRTQAFMLDSFSVDTEQLKITAPGSSFPDSLFSFTYFAAENHFQMQFRGSSPPDSVQICYRRFPYLFSRTKYLRKKCEKDTTLLGEVPLRQDDFYFPALERTTIFSVSGINKPAPSTNLQRNGSLMRGVSFGSRQDVFVNSALNLQLNGQLTESLALEATLSDRQIPYQPEGNTQQLRQFDKVYIALKHKKGKLDAGDLTLKNEPTHFLRYHKNVQGVQLRAVLGDTAKLRSESRLGVALAKGQFFSQQIEPIEGVLGPYRLTALSQGRFIVVMANSEKVYLDGVLMKRGFDQDYVIDYNTAEITFTARILISHFSRIRVNFEYAVRHYARSIFLVDQLFSKKKWEASFHVYQEKDQPNNPLSFSLSNSDRQLLSDVGDSVQYALSSTRTTVNTFDPNQILYTLSDTVVAGKKYPIFVRARQTDSLFFRVTFSEAEHGNYISTTSEANGRVFRWVAPGEFTSSTRYAPFRRLPAPNKRGMVSGKFAYKPSKFSEIYTEIAFSDQDKNLFSEKNNHNNRGLAIKTGIRLKEKPLKKWKKSTINSAFFYTYEQKNFKPIDRFRYAEFERDWGDTDSLSAAATHIAAASFLVDKNPDNRIAYSAKIRNREKTNRGIQQKLDISKRIKRLQLQVSAFSLDTETAAKQFCTNWRRLRTSVSYLGTWFVPGYVYNLDKHQRRNQKKDSLVSSSSFFESHEWFIKNPDSLPFRFNLSYQLRKDFSPFEGKMQDFTSAQTWSASAGHQGEVGKISLLFTYRTLSEYRNEKEPQKETINGRFDWRHNFFKKSLRTDFTFLTNSSRELKRAFVFLPVDLGKGTHNWRDDNKDGIRQLSEFYEAIHPDERLFAKFFRPTNEYIPAFNTQIIHKISLEFPEKWQERGNFLKFLGRLNYISSLQFQQKTTRKGMKYRLLPFIFDAGDFFLPAGRIAWQSELFFNKRFARFGVLLQNRYQKRKQMLTKGFEQNNLWAHHLSLRFTSHKNTTYHIEASKENKLSAANLLNNHNFEIQTYTIKPKITFFLSSKLRFSFSFIQKWKENLQEKTNGNSTRLTNLGVRLQWNKGNNSLFSGNFDFILVKHNGGNTNPVAEYRLLEGLKSGHNIRWNFNWTQDLKGGLQLRLAYNGRKSGSLPIVHLGNMQIIAFF